MPGLRAATPQARVRIAGAATAGAGAVVNAPASLGARIDALLPQTQCGRCGYPTCRDYAQAISDGVADINRCAPGGTEGIAALAGLLARAVLPLDPAHGCERPPQVALIDEDLCIGCTKCIQACPVDAIVGTGKRMHTVIADECTGCELCVPACPVDCIAMIDTAAQPLPRAELLSRAAHARMRHAARRQRLLPAGTGEGAPDTPAPADIAAPASAIAPLSQAEVLAAIARGRARKQARPGPGAPAATRGEVP